MRAIRLTPDQVFSLTAGRPQLLADGNLELPGGCKLTSAPMYAAVSYSRSGDPNSRRVPTFPVGHHYSLGGYTPDGRDIDDTMERHGFGRPCGTSPVRDVPVARQGSTLRLDNSLFVGGRFR